MSIQKIGIGYEKYKEFIDQEMYYVDKTSLISDIVEKGGKVTLFTRPRRFGKTLALSMLRTFFERELDRDGKDIDNSRYFEGKKIMGADKKILDMMGQYLVIKLSCHFFTKLRAIRCSPTGKRATDGRILRYIPTDLRIWPSYLK